MRSKVCVSDEHIMLGLQYNPHFCPVARAIREQVPGASGVSVTCKSIYMDVGRQWFFRVPPRSVARFIERFDKDASGKPFNFYLEIPDEERGQP
jgi:hypothetical protein